MDNKDVNYYMSLPYNVITRHINDDNGDYYYVRVLELDGCQSDGETLSEAYASIEEAMEGWLQTKLEFGDYIPEPIYDNNYSGRFNIRIPKSLHRRLAVEADEEGISLNQYALYKLAK